MSTMGWPGTYMVKAGGSITIRQFGTTVVQAVAMKDGWSPSNLVSRTFEVCGALLLGATCSTARHFAEASHSTVTHTPLVASCDDDAWPVPACCVWCCVVCSWCGADPIAPPTVTPEASGPYVTSVAVRVSAPRSQAVPDAEMVTYHYTLDGSVPSFASPQATPGQVIHLDKIG